MNNYIINYSKTSQTFSRAGIIFSTVLNTLTNNILVDINKQEHLQTAPKHAQPSDYTLDIETSPTYDPAKNVLTGTYPSSSEAEFEDIITNFFTKLSSEQESLGAEFEQVLFDNIWDMYQE